MLASWLVATSATTVALLGTVHLVYTFVGNKLRPRDAVLMSAMQAGTLTITRETTVWRAWLGFNTSHSLGAVLFGAVFGPLPFLAGGQWFFGSTYLQVLGAVVLTCYLALARRYWFSIPRRGLGLAWGLYAAGLAVARWPA